MPGLRHHRLDRLHRTRRLVGLLTIGAVVLVAGCSSGTTATTATTAPTTSAAPSSSGPPGTRGGTTTAGTAAAGSAPCTKAALLDGVAAQDPSITDVTLYKCSGQWAYAQTATSTGAILLEANGSRWSTVPAGANCQGTIIPSEIRAVACTAG